MVTEKECTSTWGKHRFSGEREREREQASLFSWDSIILRRTRNFFKIPINSPAFVGFFKKKFLKFFLNSYPRTLFFSELLLERDRGINKTRQNIDWFLLIDSLTRNGTHSAGMCSDQELNLQPFGVWDDTPTNWATPARALVGFWWVHPLALFQVRLTSLCSQAPPLHYSDFYCACAYFPLCAPTIQYWMGEKRSINPSGAMLWSPGVCEAIASFLVT